MWIKFNDKIIILGWIIYVVLVTLYRAHSGIVHVAVESVCAECAKEEEARSLPSKNTHSLNVHRQSECWDLFICFFFLPFFLRIQNLVVFFEGSHYSSLIFKPILRLLVQFLNLWDSMKSQISQVAQLMWTDEQVFSRYQTQRNA